MAGNKQRFTYEINADIGQAKKAINDLQQSIEKLSKAQINTDYLDKGINNAVGAAKELQFHLNAALNQNTGKINLNAFTQSLQQSNTSAKDLMQTLLQGGAAGQQTFTALAGAIAQSEVPLRRANKTLQDFATTLKNTIKWEISSTMVHGLGSALSGAVSYAKNLNTSLTNIRIVTGQTVEDMARFTKEANAAAKALSTTTKAYADASLIYYQQGDSQEMAAKKAAITIKAANASFETSAKEMSEYLTSVWNSYQVGADELERYVDIMANLGAKTATSLEEIATSMQKVAATANTVGVSMEQVSSIIATVSSVTRESAESIGTSYKTIFARIGDLKLGKVDEDGVGLGQVSSQLDAIGVKILDGSGNLREMGDIIMDLGNKWQTMNQAQKTAVAQVVAGKRQYTQLMALFENWDMFNANMNIAENSEGSLQKMADIYAESWEAASNKVKASLESIYGQIFEDQTIIKLMNQTSDLIEIIDKVINGFGGIGGVLKTIGALSITVFRQQIGNSINQVTKNIKMFTAQFKGQNILQIGKSLNSGSAKNVEQLQLQARTKEWSNLLSSMKSTNEIEQIALQNSTSLLSAKDQLIAAEHKLTQAQKDRAVFTLEQLSQEQNKLLALAQERQALAQQSVSDRKSGYLQTTTAIVNSQNIKRQSAQNILNNVYRKDGGFEKALETYEENAYTITAASNIQSTLQTTNNLQNAIEQVKKSLSKHITTDFLEDPKLDAQALIDKLKEVITTMEKANNKLYDKAGRVNGGQQQARTAFNKAQENAEQRYNVESQMAGLQRSIAGIKSTFTQFLDPASKASKTLGSTLTTVAGTAMSVAGAMSSAGTMVRAFTEDTFDLTSALSSFSGVAMNLAMGFSTGRIWGLVVTGLATAIGAILEISKIQKEEYQKDQTKDFEKTQKQAQQREEELSNTQSLINRYNELKSTYESTGQGQVELAATARELADAMGLVGANVAIAESNFDSFEALLKGSTTLQGAADWYAAKSAELTKNFALDKNSKYWDDSEFAKKDKVLIGADGFAGSKLAEEFEDRFYKFMAGDIASKNESNPHLMTDYAIQALQFIENNENAESEGMATYRALVEGINTNNSKIVNSIESFNEFAEWWFEPVPSSWLDDELPSSGMSFGSGDFKDGEFNPNSWIDEMLTQAEEGMFSLTAKEIEEMEKLRIPLYSDSLNSWIEKIEPFDSEVRSRTFSYENGVLSIDNEGKTLYDLILEKYNNLMKLGKNASEKTLTQGDINSFQQTVQGIWENYRASFIQTLESGIQSIEELPELDLTGYQERREKVMSAAYDRYVNDLYGQYTDAGGTETDYYRSLFNANGESTFYDMQTDEDRKQWYKNMLIMQGSAQKELDTVEAAMIEEANLNGEDTDYYKLLKARSEDLDQQIELIGKLRDKDMDELLGEIENYDELAASSVAILNAIYGEEGLIGKTEKDTSFSQFMTPMKKLQQSIDENVTDYKELEQYLVADDTGKLEIDQTKYGEYIVARDRVAARLMKDWTSFDNFTDIFIGIAQIFSQKAEDGEMSDFDKVTSFINSQGIKDIGLLSTSVIASMRKELAETGVISTEEDGLAMQALGLEESVQAITAGMESYTKYDKLASSYKDDLDFKSAYALQQELWKEGSDAWNEFVNADLDTRMAILEARKNAKLDNTMAEAETTYNELKAERDALFKDEKAKNDAQIAFDTQYVQKNGKWFMKDGAGKEVEVTDAKALKTIEKQSSNLAIWEGLNQDMKDLEATMRAMKLMGNDSIGPIAEQFNRLAKAVSGLPTDIEEFNKLVKQLGKNPIDLINMTDLERAELITQTLLQAKPALDESYIKLNEKGEQLKDKDNNPIYDWARYYQDLEAWEQGFSGATQTLWNETIGKQLAKDNDRIEKLKAQAEKEQEKANILSSAVVPGNLTNEEAAQVGINADAWASYSLEVRAATAAKQAYAAYNTEKTVLEEEANAAKNATKYLEEYNDRLLSKSNNKIIIDEEDYFKNYIATAQKAGAITADVAEKITEARQKGYEQGLRGEALIEYINAELKLDTDEANAALTELKGQTEDTFADIYSNLSTELREQASSAVDAWIEAFNTIADVRRAILGGEDVGELLAGDPKKIAQAFSAFDGTLEEFSQGLLSGTLDINKLIQPSITDDYLNDIYNSKGYDINRNLGIQRRNIARTFGVEAGSKDVTEAVVEDMTEILTSLVEDSVLKGWEDVNITDAARKIANGQSAKGYRWEDIYDLIQTNAKPFIDLSEQLREQEEIEKQVFSAVSTALDLDNIVIDENGVIKGTNLKADINGVVGDEAEYQKLATAIANAQKLTSADEWDTLSQADRDILDRYNINFNNVDSSAISCAQALSACAEAAYNLAMAAAAKQGYKYNDTLGYHTDKYGLRTETSRALDEGRDAWKAGEANIVDTEAETEKAKYARYGLEVEEVEDLAQTLQKTANESDEFSDSITTNGKKAMEIAKEISRYNLAVKEASENHATWKKALAGNDLDAYNKSIKQMRTAYSDLLDLDYEALPDSFIESTDNLKLMEKAIKGNKEAYNELQKNAAKAIYKDAFQEASEDVENLIDDMADLENIEIGQTVTVGGEGNELASQLQALYVTACNAAIQGGQSVAEAMRTANALISSIGFDIPHITMETKTIYTSSEVPPDLIPELGAAVTTDAGNFQGVKWTTKENPAYPYAVQITYPKEAMSFTKSAEGGGGGTPKKSGGGGPKKKEKKEKLRARDEIERYHKNEKVLESIESTLTEIDKLKDRAYGADHIKQLDAETEALKKQLKAQQALKEEAESYIPQDRAEFLSYGAQFDADGVITNYEDVMQAIMDEYNQAIEDYNNSAQEDSDKERLEEAKQKYDDLKDSIEKYEEAIQKAQDAANEMLEIENQMSELELEKVTYKLELEIEVNDTELEIIDYYKTKYEESLKDQDEYFGKLIEANTVYEDNLIHLRTAEEELNAKYRTGLINDADYAEGLADIQSQMLDNLNSIEDLKDEISEAYENTLEMAREQIEEITDLIDGSISSLESYINILELSGRGRDYDTLKDMYEALYQNNFVLININKAHLDSLKAEEEALLRKYNGDNEAMSEADKERHMVLRQQIQETQDALNEATQATLETLRSGFEVVIQSIGDELDHFMAGASDSLAHLQEQYDYYTETQGRYVSAAKELYEVSKLNRDIENSLTTATSSAAKEALKALQEKINKQSELNELTEYDIEMNQLQYQLLLARIKLEETQNAKDIVRLTRDENGNYAYRYTANQDKIDEAAQHYEDVLQQINDLTVQRTNEIESQIVSTMQNYKEKLMEISLDYSLTEEERLLKLEELNAQYAETMQYLQEQNNIVTQNLTDNQSAIAEHYGTNISNITASTAGNVNSSVQSMIDKANEYIAAMNGAIYGEDGILANWEGYMDKIDDVNKASGTSYENLREEALATTEILEGFQNQALDVIDTLENTLTPLSELTKAWDAHGIELDNITDKYENIVEVIQATRNAMNNFGGGTNTTANNGSGSNRGVRYATGGLADYTGLAWLDGTPEKPELVLNPTDTENLITAVGTVRSLDKGVLGHLLHSVKTTAESMMSAFNNLYHAPSVLFGRNDNSEILTQDVHITAEFPNATDRNEIEEALLGLANRASQFASRQKK